MPIMVWLPFTVIPMSRMPLGRGLHDCHVSSVLHSEEVLHKASPWLSLLTEACTSQPTRCSQAKKTLGPKSTTL